MTSTDAVQKRDRAILEIARSRSALHHWRVRDRQDLYAWQTILDRLRTKQEVGLGRYSYVSLFGLASLEALKTSIFENMEFLVPDGATSFERMISGGNAVLKHGKKLVAVAGALPKVGDAISKGSPLLFTSIRNQIICVDDLERKGAVSVKDVFGLVSYLREQRGCKIVLLLNQKKLNEENAKEFADYFRESDRYSIGVCSRPQLTLYRSP